MSNECPYCQGNAYLIDEGRWLETREARIVNGNEIYVELSTGDGNVVSINIPIDRCPKCGRKLTHDATADEAGEFIDKLFEM